MQVKELFAELCALVAIALFTSTVILWCSILSAVMQR
jgi:hypothetical protein